MARIKAAPTRSNLLRFRRDLAFAREGHDLLDQKREVLIAELMGSIQAAEDAEAEADRRLALALAALRRARITMGSDHFASVAAALESCADVKVVERSVMGVPVPRVELAAGQPPIPYSLAESTAAFDETVNAFGEVMKAVCRSAELTISVIRLASEVKKTQRRINALKNIFIPDYEATVKFIQETLEERDREAFTSMKMVKRMIARKEEAARASA